jgi:glycosyltransferase involved in cell wall biosynthesis
MGPPPDILFLNDFPPSNQNGGTVLIRRLLSAYPAANLIALTDRRHNKRLDPNFKWCAHHFSFYSKNEKGRFGIARLQAVFNLSLVPWIAIYAVRIIRRKPVSAILSVVSGTYFLAAAMVSSWTRTPLVLIVHDDWVPIVASFLPLPRRFFHFLMGWALRKASHIFSVSDGMREMLRREYGVDSEVQLPATERLEPGAFTASAEKPAGQLRILYMGNGVGAWESLMLLVDLVRTQNAKRRGLPDIELHLCAPFKVDPDPNIVQHGWVSEAEARRQVALADVLFLPYSFEDECRAITRASFPAKSADYLASGKAILVLGPEDSTVAVYARRWQCAEIVLEFNEGKLSEALARLAGSEDHRRELASNAQRAWEANHNIARQQERLFEVLGNLAAQTP